jgi:alcohol dehydrogenase
MKIIILKQAGEFEYTDTTLDEQVKADEALLKVHRIGICGTDYHAFAGRQPFFSYPRILGHELGVEVVAIGSAVEHMKVGDKCSIEPYQNTQQEKAVRRGIRMEGCGNISGYLLNTCTSLINSAMINWLW